MPSEFVHAVTKENLVTWFLLPLIHLNKFSFGSGNFLESYVTADGTKLIVEVVSILLIPGEDTFKKHYLYLSSEEGNVGTASVVYYRVPPKWHADFELFKAGQFSKFSSVAKDNIIEYSGLIYCEKDEKGDVITDARLLALERSPSLQEMWEQDLGLLPGSLKDQELLGVPNQGNYREI